MSLLPLMHCRMMLQTRQQKVWWLTGDEALAAAQFWGYDSNVIGQTLLLV